MAKHGRYGRRLIGRTIPIYARRWDEVAPREFMRQVDKCRAAIVRTMGLPAHVVKVGGG